MDSNSSIDNASDDSMDISTDSNSNDELMGTYLGMAIRIICMGVVVLTLILLLIPYTVMEKVKGTILGKLMKSYCTLGLLAMFGAFIHTLMEYVIPVTNAVCSITVYFTYYMYVGALISKVLRRLNFVVCFTKIQLKVQSAIIACKISEYQSHLLLSD